MRHSLDAFGTILWYMPDSAFAVRLERSLTEIPEVQYQRWWGEYRRHGRRLSLDALADATLAKGKVRADQGVPELWKRGRFLEVVERNRSDVELSRDVYEFGRALGYVGVRDPEGGGFVQLEVDWP